MITLDLKITIFLILLVVGLVIIGLWWKRLANRKTGPDWQMLENLPFGLILNTAEGSTAFMNNTARRIMSQLGEAEGKKVLQRFQGGGELRAGHRSGMLQHPIFLRWWCYPLQDENTLLVLAEGTDQQRYLKQQAFIGQLVHELRTPLTALVAHSEVVASAQSSEAVKAASTATIQTSAQRMASLVRDMLELHRLETTGEIPLQPTNLALVAEDAIAQLILRAEGKGVSVNFEAANPLPQVLAHPDRLRQVFLNLLDNAIKFCRPGDEICIRLDVQKGGVLCEVKDTGPGIPPAALPHITESFYRAHSELEGNGIGLALVQEILRQHNAVLIIESETAGSSTGSTFRWLLPSLSPREEK